MDYLEALKVVREENARIEEIHKGQKRHRPGAVRLPYGFYWTILQHAVAVDGEFTWGELDPLKGTSPFGHAGECCWKRVQDTVNFGWLDRVLNPDGSEKKLMGCHGKLQQVFKINDFGRQVATDYIR